MKDLRHKQEQEAYVICRLVITRGEISTIGYDICTSGYVYYYSEAKLMDWRALGI